MHPDTGAPIYVKSGRYGPYVEMDLPEEETKEEEAPKKKTAAKTTKTKRSRAKPKKAAKRASIPKEVDPSTVTLADAVKYLSLPRELGMHPKTGKPVFANTGRFGPYVGSDGEFRSIKKGDPYAITFDEALTLLATPKKLPKGVELAREIGKHPKTGKNIQLLKSKQGYFLKKGLRRIYLPESEDVEKLTPEAAAEYLK
jgi:DNA topoisomerase-1